MSILTLIIHLELNDDAFVKVQCSTLYMRSSVTKLNLAKVLKKCSGFARSDYGTIFALNEEET